MESDVDNRAWFISPRWWRGKMFVILWRRFMEYGTNRTVDLVDAVDKWEEI